MLRTLATWFQPLIQAVFTRDLPWAYRWRLLALQPIHILTYSITSLRYVRSAPFSVELIPVAPGRQMRVLVFKPEDGSNGRRQKLRPLHLDMHGGAFIGGIPEFDAPFCERLARETGAVVISTSYRFAPVNPFPAAIDDVDAVVKYLHENARYRWGADPELMTTSGFSAGGTLAMALMQQEACHLPSNTAVKGTVGFCSVIDWTLKPEEKPRPPNFFKRDFMAFLMPLFDSYAAPVRAANLQSARFSPSNAQLATLPEDILLVVAGIDILMYEELTFVERLKGEIEKTGAKERSVEAIVFDKAFHGYLELPDHIVSAAVKKPAFDAAVEFIKRVHRKHGWQQ